MAQTIIDLSGKGGLAPRFYGDIPLASANWQLRHLGADDMYADGIVNPIAKFGYLGPANNTTKAITSNPSAVIGSTIVDTINSKAYFWEYATKLHELDDLTDVALDVNRTVTGATGTDLEIYTINGARRLFYAYQKSGGGNIGIWDFASTYDDTWLSATVSGAFNTGATTDTKMIVEDNGIMYILNGTSIAKVDGTTAGGTNGTATANVILFPATFQITDGLDFGGKLWVGLMQSTRSIWGGISSSTYAYNTLCGVYIWDRKSAISDFTNFVPITGIREIRNIFSFQNTIWCFTVSVDR